MAGRSDDFFAEEYPSRKKIKVYKKEKVKRKPKKERPKLDVLWVCILIIIAFVAGILVRHFAPIGTSTTTKEETQTTQQAPALTPEQMEKGELPPGHPPIGGSESSEQGSSTTP